MQLIHRRQENIREKSLRVPDGYEAISQAYQIASASPRNDDHFRSNWAYFSYILILLAFSLLFPAITYAGNLTSIDLIERAYRNGEISYSDALNYKASAIFRPDSLPEGFQSKFPLKSATPVMMEIQSNRNLLYPQYASGFSKSNRTATSVTLDNNIVASLPDYYISPDNHFMIHYTTDNINGDAVPLTDSNSNNIPDYVEKFANILDHVWKKEIDELGYNAPPSDGTEGGNCLLDVYLVNLGAYGFTQIDQGMQASSVYLILENDFAGFPSSQEDSMEVTAAHEFFHTIQFQIADSPVPTGCSDCMGWWMEASATWMEDYVYPDANDYVHYLDRWFQHPEIPLYTYEGGIYQYGTAVWIKHMTEKYGSKFVFDVWNNIKTNQGESPVPAIENVLLENKSSLAEELKELRVANITYTYDDGPLWKSNSPIAVLFDSGKPVYPCTPSHNLFADFSVPQDINCTINPLSAMYFAFTPPAAGPGTLNITFNGDNDLSVMVAGFKSSDTEYDVTELSLKNNGGSISIKGFNVGGHYRKVVIIPLNYSRDFIENFNIYASVSGSGGDASSIETLPASASVITEDTGAGKKGKQQYYVIMKDRTGYQILDSGIAWSSDSANAVINANGLVTSSSPVTALITASLRGLSHTASLISNNPASMTHGSPRNCNTTNNKGCFIATAAFGSPLNPYVKILQEFRDQYLITNYAGRRFVSLYYYYSPSIAGRIEKSIILKAVVKIFLIPAIMFSWFMVKTTMAGKIVVGILFSALFFVYIKTNFYHPKLTLKNAQVQGRTRI